MFACNCDTDDGWCYYDRFLVNVCTSTKGTSSAEYCPDRRRRKRSGKPAILQAYSGLYSSELIERDAMENFFSFDLNRDGLISLEEAMEGTGSINNGTLDEFKQVDVNNDGLVQPAEFDQSLV